MDSREVRAVRALRIAAKLPILVEFGGDELGVLEGIADGFIIGLDSHGPLDLDKPRDWQREIDQERRDEAVYAACKREADRRACADVSDGTPEPIEPVFEDLLDPPRNVRDPDGEL